MRDQNIVTANGTAALEFAKEALLALDAAPEPLIQEWFAFHKLGYYCLLYTSCRSCLRRLCRAPHDP